MSQRLPRGKNIETIILYMNYFIQFNIEGGFFHRQTEKCWLNAENSLIDN
jgi:hypothetical protein